MRYVIAPNGGYYTGPTPESGSTDCAAQPSHESFSLTIIFFRTTGNPIRWRLKTSQEIDAELTSEADQAFDLTPKDKTILKQIFLIRKQLNPSLTLAVFKDELRNDYKGFK